MVKILDCIWNVIEYIRVDPAVPISFYFGYFLLLSFYFLFD